MTVDGGRVGRKAEGWSDEAELLFAGQPKGTEVTVLVSLGFWATIQYRDHFKPLGPRLYSCIDRVGPAKDEQWCVLAITEVVGAVASAMMISWHGGVRGVRLSWVPGPAGQLLPSRPGLSCWQSNVMYHLASMHQHSYGRHNYIGGVSSAPCYVDT